MLWQLRLTNNLIVVSRSVSLKVIFFMLFGLNHCYNPFVCNITEEANSIAVEEFHSRLLVLENRLKQLDKDEEHQMF